MKRGKNPFLNDLEKEISSLKNENYVTENRQLTEKGDETLAKAQYLCRTKTGGRQEITEMDIPFIEKYISLWPKGKLPSGASARSSVNELKGKFGTFFGEYPEYYDWSLVLQAAALYMDEAQQRSFEYTNNSENFIYRTDKFRNTSSNLAKHCQMILDESVEEVENIAPSIITIPGL